MFCPISYRKVDEHVARLNGFLTVLFLVWFFLTASFLPLIVLFFDFLIRALDRPTYSGFAVFSNFVLRKIKAPSKPTNAGPKIFASRIGFVFSALILLFASIGLGHVATTLAIVFVVCALLESVFGFCVACKIYPLLYKLSYRLPYLEPK